MGFAVTVIRDTIAPNRKRLTSVAATFPRIVLAEVNTHRDRARNAASSRAIPWGVMSGNIADDPFIPLKWGLEQSGMQTGGDIPPELAKHAEHLWRQACTYALHFGDRIHNIGADYLKSNPDADPSFANIRIHKSIPNRVVEPWMWCTQIMTATEWNNFFRLRCHPDAEIHFQRIATMIRDARAASVPEELKEGEWHMPYITAEDLEEIRSWEQDSDPVQGIDWYTWNALKISTARCARVSYLTHDKKRDLKKDVGLFETLSTGSGFGHWSPHEHPAQALSTMERSGPFVGYKQFRKYFEQENLAG